MTLRRKAQYALAMATLAIAGTLASAYPGTSFVPGHIYTPIDSGIVVEWDEDLNQVGSFEVSGVTSATGATFGPDGNLVFIGRRQGSVHVMEVDATGQILRDFDTHAGSLLRGSYIDYDPVTERYAFADNDQITILDRQLNFVGATSMYEFERASGVTWRPGGGIFATDQLGFSLVEFDANLAFVTEPIFGVNGGMDLRDTTLFITNSSSGKLISYDYVTHAYNELVTGAGFGAFADVIVLPNGNLLTTSTSNILKIYSPTGTLLDVGGLGDTGDGIAYLVVPGTSMLLAFQLGVVFCVRRCRERY